MQHSIAEVQRTVYDEVQHQSIPELMCSSCADVQRGVMQGKASQPRVLTCSTGDPVVLKCSTPSLRFSGLCMLRCSTSQSLS